MCVCASAVGVTALTRVKATEHFYLFIQVPIRKRLVLLSAQGSSPVAWSTGLAD